MAISVFEYGTLLTYIKRGAGNLMGRLIRNSQKWTNHDKIMGCNEIT